MKTIFYSALFILISLNAAAQSDGYWDKERATTKEIKVGARDRIVFKTEDFPIGTTEIVYRITLLDENQQLASSLVSVLKSIPDPTGISQGSAGAVFILSKVSGNDKCKYAIFSSNESASKYVANGKTDKACFFQNEPISKDAKRLSINKSTCFAATSEAMWFGFESKNWLMNQKIILEVVPWVDKKLSRGWTSENKTAFITQIKTSDLAHKMLNSDDFSICILEKIQKQYKFQEFQKLLTIEKTKVIKDFGTLCLTEKPANQTILNAIRLDAYQYFKNKKYAEAIDLLQIGVFDNNNATILDYNSLATNYLFSKQYQKAIKTLTEGAKINDAELLIQLNLAHAYLLNNDFKTAKEIHKKYKLQNVNALQSWKNKTKDDIQSFKNSGIENKNFDRILKLME